MAYSVIVLMEEKHLKCKNRFRVAKNSTETRKPQLCQLHIGGALNRMVTITSLNHCLTVFRIQLLLQSSPFHQGTPTFYIIHIHIQATYYMILQS